VVLLVGVWLAVIACVGLGGDFALDDDWAYAWSARRLAATGELRILGWAAPSLVAHVAWGAALVRLFGSSHVVLRAGTLGWALVGLLLLYALGRRRFEPRRALTLALAVGLSPFYVGLSFTYMTEIPWLVWMLGAMWLILDGRAGAVLGAGVLVAAAALSRQTAIIAAPAFAATLLLDGKWRRALLFAAPIGVAFVAFQLWYMRVHGATEAYREMWQRAAPARVKLEYLLATASYLGAWISPWAAAWLLDGNWRSLARRPAAWLAALALGGFALDMLGAGGAGFDQPLHPLMPYLSNFVFNFGIGPPTLHDVYVGAAPLVHFSTGIGWALTAAALVGGVVGAVWIAETRRLDPARVLFGGYALSLIAWQVATTGFLFDRYVFVLMPAAIWLALEHAPPRSSLPLVLLIPVALFSVGATREYLGWAGARDRAVRALEASGVAADQIDGGFEINAERRFAGFFARTGRLGGERGEWWSEGARYRISFFPDPRCPTVARERYWSWFRTRAIEVLDCAR
jgi:hypothetical protein